MARAQVETKQTERQSTRLLGLWQNFPIQALGLAQIAERRRGTTELAISPRVAVLLSLHKECIFVDTRKKALTALVRSDYTSTRRVDKHSWATKSILQQNREGATLGVLSVCIKPNITDNPENLPAPVWRTAPAPLARPAA